MTQFQVTRLQHSAQTVLIEADLAKLSIVGGWSNLSSSVSEDIIEQMEDD